MVFTDIEGSASSSRSWGRRLPERHWASIGGWCGRRSAAIQGSRSTTRGRLLLRLRLGANGSRRRTGSDAGAQRRPIRIRVGIRTGEPGLDPPEYVGIDVHRAARIMSAGHGGQVRVSETTTALLAAEVALSELG